MPKCRAVGTGWCPGRPPIPQHQNRRTVLGSATTVDSGGDDRRDRRWSSMHIPPSTILAGFGSLTRSELSDLLAVFEDTKLLNVVIGRIKDLGDRVGRAIGPAAIRPLSNGWRRRPTRCSDPTTPMRSCVSNCGTGPERRSASRPRFRSPRERPTSAPPMSPSGRPTNFATRPRNAKGSVSGLIFPAASGPAPWRSSHLQSTPTLARSSLHRPAAC